MVQNRYSLDPRQARICRGAAWLFLLAALVRTAVVLVPWAAGAIPAATMLCGQTGCRGSGRPDLLLPAEYARAVAGPSERARFADHVHRPAVRTALVGLDLAGAAPFSLLMLWVGIAMRRLGTRSGDSMAAALPWLRRASYAALVTALVPSLVNSLRTMLLLPATPEGPSWYLEVDFGRFLASLLLALAAFAVTWALAAGIRAGRDVAEFV